MAASRKRAGALACGLGLAVAGAGCGGPESVAPPSPGPAVSALSSGGGRTFAAFSQTCAVVDGGVQCWGANMDGQLGGAGISFRAGSPIHVAELPRPATAVSSGGRYACAIAAGGVHCWGANGSRQLGNDRVSLGIGPHPVEGLPAPVTAIAAGRDHTCAVASGRAFCWGDAKYGALGREGTDRCGRNSRYPCSAEPAGVRGLGRPVDGIAAGDHFTCATVSGEVVCWGLNDESQLGRETEEVAGPPRAVSGLPGPATAIASGRAHTCALVGGRAHCWGANDSGQLGGSPGDARAVPAAVPGLPGDLTQISAGRAHGCAIAGGRVHCWGDGRHGQRGVPAPGSDANLVPGLPASATAISTGSDVSCAALVTGRVYCWGDNDFGQLGSGDAPSDKSGAVAVLGWDTGRIRDRNGDGAITVACVGDSNTRLRPEVGTTWCELLAEQLPEGWTTVNRGRGGATAVDEGSFVRASDQLRYTLENDGPDVVILAFGTNDVFVGATPTQIAAAYAMHGAMAAESGVLALFALTPPMRPGGQRDVGPAIEAANAMLLRVFPRERIVDFATGIGEADMIDRVHVNLQGHRKRAKAASEALRGVSDLGSKP